MKTKTFLFAALLLWGHGAYCQNYIQDKGILGCSLGNCQDGFGKYNTETTSTLGFFKDGKMNGPGIIYNKQLKSSTCGEWKDNQLDGFYVYDFNDGEKAFGDKSNPEIKDVQIAFRVNLNAWVGLVRRNDTIYYKVNIDEAHPSAYVYGDTNAGFKYFYERENDTTDIWLGKLAKDKTYKKVIEYKYCEKNNFQLFTKYSPNPTKNNMGFEILNYEDAFYVGYFGKGYDYLEIENYNGVGFLRDKIDNSYYAGKYKDGQLVKVAK